MITTAQAVASLRPGVEWSMNGNDVEGIIWHTEGAEPLTTAEVQAEMQRLEQVAVDEVDARAALRASAEAKLAALGLTVDEITTIVPTV
jgi:hypothetical protein